ncbi:MAG: hypothetical protein IPM83_15595 [Ignavibacteria bacterium]|nr:hypothetical protein [Ignavibacteria bacterium]
MAEPRMYRRNVYHQREVAWLLLVASSALLIAYRVPNSTGVSQDLFDVPWFIIEILITAVFIVDPFVKFASARQRGPEFVRRHVRTWLPFDGISALPIVLSLAALLHRC